jgi:large subunit ribosomal protein L6
MVSVIADQYNNLWGLVRTLIDNMVVWVTTWFEKKLHIIGVGFSAKATGQNLTMNLWFSHPVESTAPAWITFTAEKDPKGNDIVTVQGIDKQLVGQVAASLRSLRKPEPYKGKWVRYFGEKVRQKAGKTAGK